MEKTGENSFNFLSGERGAQIVQNMHHRTVVVFGDCMLDEFVWGEVTRISPEAPVPVVEVRRESVHLGGAANVLANLLALGVQACVVGVLGDDPAGERMRAKLRQANAFHGDELMVVDPDRPSTIKSRIIAHNQLVVRADREKRTPVDAATEGRLIETLHRVLKEADALIVSDYEKGAVTPGVLSQILPYARERGIPVLIDPKIKNFDSYCPATLITPNHHEALRLTGLDDHSDEGVERAARMIKERINCGAVLITRGERGMMIVEGDGPPVLVPTAAREVYDVTGAGDTAIATLGAALSAGASILEGAILANHAAGVVVGKVGTATVSANELIESLGRQ